MIQSISDNGVSKVWRDGVWVFKDQPSFLTTNEIWCLETLYPTGYVPYAERINLTQIIIQFIETTPITKPGEFMTHLPRILETLEKAGIRHGDLTEYAIIPHDNRPFLIDFAESRLTCDPREDKRPEGDVYWLERTMRKLCGMI